MKFFFKKFPALFDIAVYIYHYLRFNGFIKINYNTKGFIDFKSNVANIFFKKKLKKSKIYLEYGSGNSTLVAQKLKKKVFSIESDPSFYRYLKKKINKDKNINYILKDLGIVSYWSVPLKFTKMSILLKKANSYSSDILDILKLKRITPDLVLVDGRFRVLVGLYLYNFFLKQKIKKKFTIIFDDFKTRPDYNILKKYFFISTKGRLGVTTKIKKNINSESDIKKYIFNYL